MSFKPRLGFHIYLKMLSLKSAVFPKMWRVGACSRVFAKDFGKFEHATVREF